MAARGKKNPDRKMAGRLKKRAVIMASCWVLAMVGLGQLPTVALISLLPAIASYKATMILAAHAAQPMQLAPGIKLTILAATLHGLLLAGALAFLA